MGFAGEAAAVRTRCNPRMAAFAASLVATGTLLMHAPVVPGGIVQHCARACTLPDAIYPALAIKEMLAGDSGHFAKTEKCSASDDCGLAGDCRAGKCDCDAAWTGPTCTALALCANSSLLILVLQTLINAAPSRPVTAARRGAHAHAGRHRPIRSRNPPPTCCCIQCARLSGRRREALKSGEQEKSRAKRDAAQTSEERKGQQRDGNKR